MSNFSFHILDTVDSTNNYAMASIREGMAKHGECWFALSQSAGRGQLGRHWESAPGQNILLSCVIAPPPFFFRQPFLYNMLIACTVHEFLQGLVSEDFNIKWPNDLYVRDRKAGGILIENVFRGQNWIYSVVGIGINVNQQTFVGTDKLPISLSMLTEQPLDSIQLGAELAKKIISAVDEIQENQLAAVFEHFNNNLYQKGQKIQLSKAGEIMETTLVGVDELGRLVTQDTEIRTFMHGEVTFVK